MESDIFTDITIGNPPFTSGETLKNGSVPVMVFHEKVGGYLANLVSGRRGIRDTFADLRQVGCQTNMMLFGVSNSA